MIEKSEIKSTYLRDRSETEIRLKRLENETKFTSEIV